MNCLLICFFFFLYLHEEILINDDLELIHLKDSRTGGLMYENYLFHKSGVVKRGKTYYRCAQKRVSKCKAALNIDANNFVRYNNIKHNHQPKAKNVSKLSGKKILYDGHAFYRHSSMENKIHWRCTTSHCPVRIHTDLHGSIVAVRGKHKH